MKKYTPATFPFTSNYIDVSDTTIHFIDVIDKIESDATFLFIHGNPTSSYIWRNIIPYLIPLGRCIALDLVGFGKSGKPNIDFTFQDHIKYVNGFINKLELKNIVLVVHDWGGAIGFNYAMNNPKNVRGIVFMETFCKPMEWDKLNFLARWIFKKFRNPVKGQKWNGKYNLFLRFILPISIIRKLSKEERNIYFEPFKKLENRRPIIKFPQELPFKNENTPNNKIATDYYEFLKRSEIPKLLLYAKPGVQIREKEVELYKSEFPKLTTTFIGKGKHYIQEDQPDNIGEAIAQWYVKKFNNIEKLI